MTKYDQYCPVARASEIFADRWTPLIIRELLAGSRHFNAIERGLPGISRSLLSERLRLLEMAGAVTRSAMARPRPTIYELTQAGRELKEVIDALGRWGARWAFGEPRPEELNPILLLWKVHQRINCSLLPPRRVVLEFDFQGARGKTTRLWLVLERTEVSMCLKDPGFDPDVAIRADLATFYSVWLGRLPLSMAMRSGKIRLEGAPSYVRALPSWLRWSPMADAVRAAAKERSSASSARANAGA